MAPRRGLAALKPSPSKTTVASDDQVSLNPDAAAQSQLSDLAKKVPQVRRSGDETQYARDLLVRNALAHVIDLLSKKPSYTLECWSWLDGKIHGNNNTAQDQWGDSYTNWVKALCGEGGEVVGGIHILAAPPELRLRLRGSECEPVGIAAKHALVGPVSLYIKKQGPA